MCRRSLLAKEGEDSELAEENFWEEMDKMCRQEKICRKCEKFLDNDMDMNMFRIFLFKAHNVNDSLPAGVLWEYISIIHH